MNIPINRLIAILFSAILLLSACGSNAATNTDTNTTESTTAPVASLPERDEVDDAANDGLTEAAEPESATGKLSADEAELKFQQCLEDAGVEDPFGGAQGESIEGNDGAPADPVADAVTLDAEDFEVLERCSEILDEAFGEFNASPEQEALIRDAELQFTQCMTDKGFDVSVNGNGIELSGDIDIEDLNAAASECDSAFDSLNSQLEAESADS